MTDPDALRPLIEKFRRNAAAYREQAKKGVTWAPYFSNEAVKAELHAEVLEALERGRIRTNPVQRLTSDSAKSLGEKGKS